MEEKLKTLLKAAAKPHGIPVIDDELPGDINPCVTFNFYQENGSLYGGGKATEESESVQVDLWYKTKSANVLLAIQAIKQVIISENSYSYPVKNTIYEAGNKIYHTYFIFEVIKESEE